MKTKQCKVRLKDIHHSMVLYIAHPKYGINKVKVLSKPYVPDSLMEYANGGNDKQWLFVDVASMYRPNLYNNSSRSLADASITVPNNHDYRTFRKLKQAEAYVERFKDHVGY